MALMTSAPTAAPKRGRRAKADTGLSICLDYLKGKCTREQCRFTHPDLTAYQQLAETLEAQAGREICEVWALSGQCKFGSKCNKLHPILVSHPSVVAIPHPAAPLPSTSVVDTTTETHQARAQSPGLTPDLTAEFENFAESMMKTLAEEEEEEEECWQPSGKGLTAGKEPVKGVAPPCSTARRFLRSVLGLDSVLIDIFQDLNLISC